MKFVNIQINPITYVIETASTVASVASDRQRMNELAEHYTIRIERPVTLKASLGDKIGRAQQAVDSPVAEK